jgi:hypothetical protein
MRPYRIVMLVHFCASRAPEPIFLTNAKNDLIPSTVVIRNSQQVRTDADA